LREVFDYAIESSKSSKTFLDTAELYGLGGRSETLMGDFSKDYAEDKLQVATKFAALPFGPNQKTSSKPVRHPRKDSLVDQ
jgi:aryl-alcohol dehydrogenase-like predicted oxidoreductase